MSLTPIFDATLADAPRNIWQASHIFPQPIRFEIPWDSFAATRAALAVQAPIVALSDPANLSTHFLRSADA